MLLRANDTWRYREIVFFHFHKIYLRFKRDCFELLWSMIVVIHNIFKREDDKNMNLLGISLAIFTSR